MKPVPHDEVQLTEWLFRYGPPILAWTAVIGFFAFAGSVSDDVPTRMADSAFTVVTVDDEVAAGTTWLPSETSTREREPRDAAVAEHEALDPVGAGHSTTP